MRKRIIINCSGDLFRTLIGLIHVETDDYTVENISDEEEPSQAPVTAAKVKAPVEREQNFNNTSTGTTIKQEIIKFFDPLPAEHKVTVDDIRDILVPLGYSANSAYSSLAGLVKKRLLMRVAEGFYCKSVEFNRAKAKMGFK